MTCCCKLLYPIYEISHFIMVKGHTTGVVLLIIIMVNDMKHKTDHDVKLSFLLFSWSRRWDW